VRQEPPRPHFLGAAAESGTISKGKRTDLGVYLDAHHPRWGRPDRPDRRLGKCFRPSWSNVTYPGGAHGLGGTAKDQVNTDLLAFLKSW